MKPLRILTLLFTLWPVMSCAYEIELLTPRPEVEEYEFVISPDGVEKSFLSATPVIDSNDLPLGRYEYKRRIKKNNQWSAWSPVKIMHVYAYSEKYKGLRIEEIKTTLIAEASKKVEQVQPVAQAPVVHPEPPAPEVLPLPDQSPSKFLLTPYLAALSRSVQTDSENISAEGTEHAQRFGLNLKSGSLDSQVSYETGEIYSRLDLWAMKAITSFLQVGARLTQVTADFDTSEGSAKVSNTYAFFQVSSGHETQNGFGLRLSGAGTLQGSYMGSLHAYKAWQVNPNFRLVPTIGHEILDLRSKTSKLRSSSWLTGLFFEFDF